MRASGSHGKEGGAIGPRRGDGRAPFFGSRGRTARSARLKNRLVAAYAGTAAIAISIIGGTSYLYSVKTYRDDMISKSMEVMKQISRSLEANVHGIDALVNLLYMKRDSNYEPIVRRLTGPMPDVPSSLLSSDREFSSYFNDVVYLRPDCVGIMIHGVNGWEYSRSISGAEGSYTEEQAWYAKTMENRGGITVHGTHRQFYTRNGKPVFSLSRQLVNLDTSEFIGVMMLDFDITSIREICQGVDLGPDGRVIVCDDAGDVVYDSDESRIMTRLEPAIQAASAGREAGIASARVDGGRPLVIHLASGITGWRLVSVVPMKTLTWRWRFIGLATLLVGVLMLAAMVGISLLIAGSITRPIGTMNDLMRQVGAGDYEVSIESARSDEIGQLNEGFNTMVQKIRQLIQREYVSKLMERDAELKALQAQINPHFIYNTLELISTISIVKNVPEVDAVALALSRMLRYSIKGAGAVVPLGAELRHVEDFFSIYRVRFDNSVRVRDMVDARYRGYGILRLTVQPLVENAFLHGFHEGGRDGCITISAREEGDDLRVEVSDDGAGMDARTLQAVRGSLARGEGPGLSERDSTASIGLRNVHARIALYYGPGYGVSVESAPDAGTRVWLKVPRRIPDPRTVHEE